MKRTTALTVFSSLIVGIAGERALRRNNIFDERRRDDRPPRPPQNPPTPPENTLPVGDLNIRFNKITDVDRGIPPGPNPMPMQFDDYPLDRNTADWLRQTQAVSVVRYQDCGECDIPTHRLVAEVGGGPSHPSADVSDPYWEELGEVVRVQQARLRGDDPTMVMHLPDIWAGFNIDEVAEAVHDEFPGVHHITLLESLLASGAKIDRSIIPSPSYVEFLRGPVLLSDMNTWAIATVGPHNFGAKWFAGRARPEEVAHKIKVGDILAEYVPTEIVSALSEMDFDTAPAFTAYPEGSPNHPSWPAMHSAASAGSIWMPLVMDLSEAQLCEVKAVNYGVAYARTVAGVHFPSDNIDGLNLGQEILARKLPEYLSERYGSNPRVVREKIETLRFDWNEYLQSSCFN